MLHDQVGPLEVELGVVGLQRVEAVDVAVVHAERRRDENGVVDLEIGRALAPGRVDVRARDALAVDRDLAGDVEERAQLGVDRGGVGVALDLFDEVDASVELDGCERGVRVLAEHRPVPARDVGGDQLAIPGRQGVLGAQQLLRERVEMNRRLRPELHRAANARNPLG